MNPSRFDRLDTLRGIAIVWMAVFHFCFDLNYFGLLPVRQNFYQDPVWTLQRICIVSLFLFSAGMGQAAALHTGQAWGRFWKRWLQIFDCAVLVSAASALVFPKSWISFGVLHGIAVMLVLARAMAPLGRGLWLIGLIAIVLPLFVSHPFFDSRLTNWVGLVTHKPVTEDFVPVLPWLGVMCWGLASGRWLLAHKPAVLTGAVPLVAGPLAALGRYSLSFYMLHQPVLIGGIMAYLHWHA